MAFQTLQIKEQKKVIIHPSSRFFLKGKKNIDNFFDRYKNEDFELNIVDLAGIVNIAIDVINLKRLIG